MSKGEPVSMLVLEKICDKLDCDFGDLVHFDKNERFEDKVDG
jgi:DNA-binding Xre family transcriptional regulator